MAKTAHDENGGAGGAASAVTLDRFAGAFTALCGLLVAAPSLARLDRVRDEELLGDWPLLEDPDSRRGVDLLRKSALAHESEGEVRRDYNRLFFGPGPMIAPPYESVHRSQDHLIFDLQTMQVRAAYAQFGMAAPRLNQEPDDHIGLEIGFLGSLCVQGMNAIDDNDDAALARIVAGIQSLLDSHLLVWGPHCLTLAANGSQTLFYQGIAAMSLGALQHARAVFLPNYDC